MTSWVAARPEAVAFDPDAQRDRHRVGLPAHPNAAVDPQRPGARLAASAGDAIRHEEDLRMRDDVEHVGAAHACFDFRDVLDGFGSGHDAQGRRVPAQPHP